jgi:hypothetical protein
MIVMRLAGMSMSFRMRGMAHWETEPHPIMSNLPLNFTASASAF